VVIGSVTHGNTTAVAGVRERPLMTTVDLAIKRPSAILILASIALGVLPLLIGAHGCATVLALPDRVTLVCQRSGEVISCNEIRWWKTGGGWKSQIAARHAGQRAAIKYFRIGGSTAKSCVAFDSSSACGGDGRANAAALQSLPDGGQTELDATRSETFGLVMGYGSLTGMLLFVWLVCIGVLIGRVTRVRLNVFPTHLDVTKSWAGLTARSRRIQRLHHEMVQASLQSRGGRGSLPTWQLTYDGTTNEGIQSSTELLAVQAISQPAELEDAAMRTRAALAQIPRSS